MRDHVNSAKKRREYVNQRCYRGALRLGQKRCTHQRQDKSEWYDLCCFPDEIIFLVCSDVRSKPVKRVYESAVCQKKFAFQNKNKN